MVPATAAPSSIRARPAAAGSSVTVTPPILPTGRADAHAGRRRPHHSGSAPVSTTEHEICPAATAGERRAATVLAHGRPHPHHQPADRAGRRSDAPRSLDRRLAPGGPRLLGVRGQAGRPPQPLLLGVLRAHRLLDLEPVVGARALPAR